MNDHHSPNRAKITGSNGQGLNHRFLSGINGQPDRGRNRRWTPVRLRLVLRSLKGGDATGHGSVNVAGADGRDSNTVNPFLLPHPRHHRGGGFER